MKTGNLTNDGFKFKPAKLRILLIATQTNSLQLFEIKKAVQETSLDLTCLIPKLPLVFDNDSQPRFNTIMNLC